MNHILKKIICALLIIAGFSYSGIAQSQPLATDSLSLESIISEVVQNHPMVKKAIEEIKVSDSKIGIAKSVNLPTVGFESSYTRIGPIAHITIPDMGSFSLIPHDSYSASVSANQVLYDFGKTEKNIQVEMQGKELSGQSVEQVKQKLSQAVIANYYALVYLQEAVKIKDEQLQMLNEHLNYIRKKLETGSATTYEVLTTQVRISNTENQKTDILTARLITINQINSFLGKPESTNLLVKRNIKLAMSELPGDSLFASAMRNRDEMKLALEKDKLAKMRYSLVSAQNNPVVSAFASGGFKNGYIPYMYDPRGNFSMGIGLKIPIFDGHRKDYSLTQAQSAVESNNQETEIARRGIVDEIVEAEANLNASQKKVDQSELQLKQAIQAYELAKIKFDSGVITNLELIEGSTTVSESRLLLLKSKIDFTVNSYKLKSSIGQRLY